MRKLLVLALALALVAPGTVPVARADGQVIATWMLTELHQGGHGGGPLYADGTAGGTLAISTQNGQFRAMFLPVTWSWLVPGSVLYLCSDVRVIQLPAGSPPPPATICGTFTVTGRPQPLDANGDGKADVLVRVTLVG